MNHASKSLVPMRRSLPQWSAKTAEQKSRALVLVIRSEPKIRRSSVADSIADVKSKLHSVTSDTKRIDAQRAFVDQAIPCTSGMAFASHIEERTGYVNASLKAEWSQPNLEDTKAKQHELQLSAGWQTEKFLLLLVVICSSLLMEVRRLNSRTAKEVHEGATGVGECVVAIGARMLVMVGMGMLVVKSVAEEHPSESKPASAPTQNMEEAAQETELAEGAEGEAQVGKHSHVTQQEAQIESVFSLAKVEVMEDGLSAAEAQVGGEHEGGAHVTQNEAQDERPPSVEEVNFELKVEIDLDNGPHIRQEASKDEGSPSLDEAKFQLKVHVQLPDGGPVAHNSDREALPPLDEVKLNLKAEAQLKDGALVAQEDSKDEASAIHDDAEFELKAEVWVEDASLVKQELEDKAPPTLYFRLDEVEDHSEEGSHFIQVEPELSAPSTQYFQLDEDVQFEDGLHVNQESSEDEDSLSLDDEFELITLEDVLGTVDAKMAEEPNMQGDATKRCQCEGADSSFGISTQPLLADISADSDSEFEII